MLKSKLLSKLAIVNKNNDIDTGAKVTCSAKAFCIATDKLCFGQILFTIFTQPNNIGALTNIP